jgi:hypothetical protein
VKERGSLLLIVAARRLTGIAVVTMEQAAHLIAQTVAPAIATAWVAVAARGSSRRSCGRRHGGNFLVSRLADQHGPCHQQERSIHEDSSISGLSVWPRFGILDSRGTPPASCLSACASFVMKRKPHPPDSPVSSGRTQIVLSPTRFLRLGIYPTFTAFWFSGQCAHFPVRESPCEIRVLVT